jgi:predicted RNA-binding Zn-ribbon protein involved in translation (DUF1610 family)
VPATTDIPLASSTQWVEHSCRSCGEKHILQLPYTGAPAGCRSCRELGVTLSDLGPSGVVEWACRNCRERYFIELPYTLPAGAVLVLTCPACDFGTAVDGLFQFPDLLVARSKRW